MKAIFLDCVKHQLASRKPLLSASRTFRRCMALFTVLLIAISPAPAQPLIGPLSFYQMDFFGSPALPVMQNTEWGDVSIPLGPNPGNSDRVFFHLWARLNPTDSLEPVILNMVLPPGDSITTGVELYRYFSLETLGVTRGTDVKGTGTIRAVYETSAIAISPSYIPIASEFVYNVGSSTENTNVGIPDVSDNPQPGVLGSPPVVDTSTTPGLTAPRHVIREDMPVIGEDDNQCFPVSIARSVEWLKKRGDVSYTTGTDDLVTSLSEMANWDIFDGVQPVPMLAAKLRISKDLNLHNKFQGLGSSGGDFVTSDGVMRNGGGAKPTYEFIMNEMKNGEDVEILVGWMNADGTRSFGHAMTVVGVDETTGGKKEISVQDAKQQGPSHNTPPDNRVRRVKYDESGTTPTLDGLKSNRVELVLSESPRPKLTEAQALAPNRVRLKFDRNISPGAVDGVTSFTISGPGIGTLDPNPSEVLWDPEKPDELELLWPPGQSMVNGSPVDVKVDDSVEDDEGNPIGEQNNTASLPGLPVTISLLLIE